MDLAPLTARRAAALAGIDLARLGPALAALAEPVAPLLAPLAAELAGRVAAQPEVAARLGGRPLPAVVVDRVTELLHRLIEGPHDGGFWVDLATAAREIAQAGLPLDLLLPTLRLLQGRLQELLGRRRGAAAAAVDLEQLMTLVLAVTLQAHGREREERFRHTERLATLGKIVAEVNHDLQNPLAVIRTSLYALERRLGPEVEAGARVHLERMKRNSELAVRIAGDLLDLARHRRPATEEIDLDAFLRDILAEQEVPPGVEVRAELDPGAGKVAADPTMLDRVVRNLIRNSLQAMGGQGTLVVASARSEGSWTIRIRDTGPGFPPGDLERVFEPLFSTRPEGAGLGLPIARRLVEAHAGTIAAHNPPEGGAEVVVTLPAPAPG